MLPFWSAFNLHYALHWLLAFCAMRALAKALGQGAWAALFSALTYAASGYLLSALTYYNILTVVAWWPLVLWGGARGDRRGVAGGGLACGMALLGGEPITALLGVVPLVLVSLRDAIRTSRSSAVALRRTPTIGGIGLLIALPQLVATWRVLPFTYRFAHGFDVTGDALSRLPAWRLLELFVPLPFGAPFLSGAAGFVGYDFLPHLPYVLTLYFGVVGLVLALLAARAHRGWTALAGVGVLGALVLTLWPGSVEHLSAGLARYPEKLLFWFALGAALLAGWGFERALAEPGLAARRFRLLAVGLLVAGVAYLLGGSRWVAWVQAHQPTASDAVATAQMGMWLFFLFAGALVLALAAWAAARRSAAGLLTAQLVALLPLFVVLPTDATAPYREPSALTRALPPEAAVFNGTFLTALGDLPANYRIPDGRLAWVRRLAAQDLLPAPGVLHGLRYPLAPDFDGMDSAPLERVLAAFPRLSWEQRARWLRLFGVDGAVLTTAPDAAGVRRIASEDHGGVSTGLYAFDGSAPAVWWPAELVGADSPEEAFRAISELPDPQRTAVVLGAPPPQDPAGSVRLLEAGPDRLVLETAGAGGVVAITRAIQPLLRASTGGEPLPTVQLDLVLLGVQVPAGEHRVVVEASAWPEAVAAMVALFAAAATLVAARRAVPR